MLPRILGFVLWIFYRSLSLTWRISVEEPEQMRSDVKSKTPMILAHWHGDEIPLVALTPRYKIATIVSTSKDGEMMNVLLRLLGGKTSRGSSTRGGASALKGLIRLVRLGMNCSFAVDGPKGPIHQVKPGVFELSRVLNCPIYSAGVLCDRAWIFEKSWNKAYLPKPFAKIKVVWVGPYGPIQRDDDPRENSHSTHLTEALHKAKAISSKNFAPVSSQC